MSTIIQRDQALSMLDSKLTLLSKLYKECYLSMGRGALLVYPKKVIERGLPTKGSLRNKFAILSVEAPAWQGTKAQEYQAYFELS
ncbi:MAG: hypothetical protein PHP23_12100 [Desulfobacterales bacterium]|nr:hypothetical protein [Desulfobacterales bacterium]MDD4073771.1 hypothetical protein [Desulfobacterales bacterium]MDD4392918.1 hypothetical protein [Desulfobacterales bacterium]